MRSCHTLAFLALTLMLVQPSVTTRNDIYTAELKRARSEAADRALDYLRNSREALDKSWKPEEAAAAFIGLLAGDPVTWVPGYSQNKVTDLQVQNSYLATRYGMLQLLDRYATLHPIDHSTLVQIVGAVTIMCDDPRDFNGHDLVKELETRHGNTRNDSPGLATLFLGYCLAGVPLQPRGIQRMITSRRACKMGDAQLCFESASIMMLAVSCMGKRTDKAQEERPDEQAPYDSAYLAEVIKAMATELRTYKMENGSFGNIYRDALGLQLLAIYPTLGQGVWDANALLRTTLSYQNPGEPTQRFAGSFGHSPSFTALVIPALTEVTPEFIVDRSCPEKKFVVEDHFVAVDYKIVDKVGRSQSIVGTFYAVAETEAAVALERFARKNPELITVEIQRSFFGPVLTDLNGIRNNAAMKWNVFLTNEKFEPVNRKENGLARAIIPEIRFLFSYERK